MGWIGRRGWLVLFALAIVVQLVGLYAPRAPSGGGIPGLDKVAHAAMFLAPALLGLLAGIRPVVLAPLLVFAIGLIWSDHVWKRVRSGFPLRRRIGLTLAALAVPMIASGYLLQTSVDETWHEVWVWTHVGSSVVWIAAYLAHLVSPR